MRSIEVNNVRLYYIEHGSGKTTLFFGHGTLISSNIWRDFYFPSLPMEWHSLALDFRGHGASSSIKTGCNFVQLADDVAEMVKMLDMGKIIYIGLSMGGGVGLQLALRHPEILKGLILISPVTGLGPVGNAIFTRFGKFIAGKRSFLRLGMSSVSTQKPDPVALEKVVDEAMQVSSETLREYLSPTNVIEGTEYLSGISVPVLLMIGLKNRIIPIKQQLKLAKLLPDRRCKTFPEYGHALAAENHGEILSLVTEFVTGLS